METTYRFEKAAAVVALLIFACGMGLMMDGKKLYQTELRKSARVDYHSTLNPYQ